MPAKVALAEAVNAVTMCRARLAARHAGTDGNLTLQSNVLRVGTVLAVTPVEAVPLEAAPTAGACRHTAQCVARRGAEGGGPQLTGRRRRQRGGTWLLGEWLLLHPPRRRDRRSLGRRRRGQLRIHAARSACCWARLCHVDVVVGALAVHSPYGALGQHVLAPHRWIVLLAGRSCQTGGSFLPEVRSWPGGVWSLRLGWRRAASSAREAFLELLNE